MVGSGARWDGPAVRYGDAGGLRAGARRAPRVGGRDGLGASGRSTRTRAPDRPGSGSTKRMVPPCRSVTQRAMARPRPVPPPPLGVRERAEPLEHALPVAGRDTRPLVGDLEPPAGPPGLGASGPDGAARRDCAARRCRAGWRRAGGAVPGRRATARSGGVDADVVRHVAAGDAAPRRRRRRAGRRTSTSRRASGALPASTRERSSRSTTSADHPLALVERGAQGHRVRLGDAVGEVLEHGVERGERRAQLVADVGDQVAALPVDGGEVLGHPVERAGELADLVARGGGDPGAVVARAPSAAPPRSSRAAARSCRRRAAG